MTQGFETIAAIEQEQAALKALGAKYTQEKLDAIKDPALRTFCTTLIEKKDALGDTLAAIIKHEASVNGTSVLLDEKQEARMEKL